MYDKINLEKALETISREITINREQAEKYSHNNPIWTARMAAVHIGQMLFAIILEARERGIPNAE